MTRDRVSSALRAFSAKGQITLPKDIREILGVGTGDRVTLICRDNQVIMMNAAVYAMNMLQEGMKGEFEKAGLRTDDDVMDAVKEVRSEIEGSEFIRG
jgi:AbrB family looped-hinge helix DNA binding protein